MRLDISRQRKLLNSCAHESHEPVVIYFDPQLVQKAAQSGCVRYRVDKNEDASLFVPEISQHFHFVIGKIVLRSDDHYCIHIGRDYSLIEKV